jgi:hypothetical protein
MGDAMESVLTNDGTGYPPDSLAFHFLNNNDTGPRFVSSYGLDFYRVAAAMHAPDLARTPVRLYG